MPTYHFQTRVYKVVAFRVGYHEEPDWFEAAARQRKLELMRSYAEDYPENQITFFSGGKWWLAEEGDYIVKHGEEYFTMPADSFFRKYEVVDDQ